jgi:hypothetical protein
LDRLQTHPATDVEIVWSEFIEQRPIFRAHALATFDEFAARRIVNGTACVPRFRRRSVVDQSSRGGSAGVLYVQYIDHTDKYVDHLASPPVISPRSRSASAWTVAHLYIASSIVHRESAA